MKRFVCFLIFILLLSGCGLRDERRTPNDAFELANNHEGFDIVHFVVPANCDYDYFFEYDPMRVGGFYAYGYDGNQPKLLVIPKQTTHEAKLYAWPLVFAVEDAVELLNTAFDDDLIPEDSMYSHIRIELTNEVLNDFSTTDYDHAFFIVITVGDDTYIAFQQNYTLVIYHQDDGLFLFDEPI